MFLNNPVLQQPEAYLCHIAASFDEAGKLTSDPLRELLGSFALAFERLIARSS